MILRAGCRQDLAGKSSGSCLFRVLMLTGTMPAAPQAHATFWILAGPLSLIRAGREHRLA